MPKRLFPLVVLASMLLVGVLAMPAASGDDPPTGEHVSGNGHGKASIEPAYDDTNGNLIFLLTPEKAPLPSHANGKAVAPLYLVEYPPGTDFGVHLNCEGVPGNCPDHDGLVAAVATGQDPLGLGDPGVYGTDPTLVPGHDHLVAPPTTGEDFNVAWEVIEVLFTDSNHVSHLTTEDQVNDAVSHGFARKVDLGFAFNCSVVSRSVYDHGSRVEG